MNVDDARFLFLKLNIWLCLASALMVAITAIALEIPLSAVGLGVALPPLLFYFIYVEDRRRVSAEDEVNQPHRTALVRAYQLPLLVTEAVALLGYEGLLLWFVLSRPDVGAVAFALGHLPLVVLAVYGHLKRYPTFDSLAVGSTWAFVVVFAVVVATPQPFTWDLGGVFLSWFFITFAGVESRNIQDIDGDITSDKTTLAGHLGPTVTTAFVGTVKSLGVLTFWMLFGWFVAGLVVGYLSVVRLFRSLTRRETARVQRAA